MKPKKRPTSKSAKKLIQTPDVLPTGTLTVTVTRFRSLGALTPLEAKLSDWSGFQMPHGRPLPTPAPTLEIKANNIIICSQYPIRLIYNLPDSRYLLIGAAWEAVVKSHVGQETFPDVLNQRNCTIPAPYQAPVPGGSCMTVKDNAQDPGTYEYVLLIQDTESGEIGMFDPGMDNQPEQ